MRRPGKGRVESRSRSVAGVRLLLVGRQLGRVRDVRERGGEAEAPPVVLDAVGLAHPESAVRVRRVVAEAADEGVLHDERAVVGVDAVLGAGAVGLDGPLLVADRDDLLLLLRVAHDRRDGDRGRDDRDRAEDHEVDSPWSEHEPSPSSD